MDHLPVEVITNIMRFLSVYDRKEVALVNRQWYDASLDPILVQNMVVTCTFPCRAGTTEEIFSSLVRRRTPNLVLEQLDDSFQRNLTSTESIQYLKNHLISLSLKGSDITERAFVSVIARCYSLRKLDLSCCSNLFISGVLLSDAQTLAGVCDALQNLTELNLSSIRHLTDQTLNRMVAVAPNLSTLHLTSNTIVFYMDSFVSHRNTQSSSSVMLTFTNLHMLLKERAHKITSLSLSRTLVNDAAIVQIARVPDLVLDQLHLVNCTELSPDGMVNFCKLQSSLTVLDISQCRQVTDGVIASICNNLHNLRLLRIGKCSLVTDDSISMLSRLTELRTLDLLSCHQLTSRGLIVGLCGRDRSHLRDLTLKCCTKVNDELFLEACLKLCDITHLDLASTSITNKSLMLISKFMTRLQSLSLSWCRRIDDAGLLGNFEAAISKFCQEEDHDGCCNCSREEKKSLIFNKPSKYQKKPKHLLSLEMRVCDMLGGVAVPLSNLRCLENLDLSTCQQLTDAGIVVVAGLPVLRFLSLAHCSKLTDETLVIISHKNNCLEHLNVSHNANYTDSGLKQIACRLRGLTSLNISNCDGLTDVGIGHLRKHCRRLKNLDVSLNSAITERAVESLENSLSHLLLHKRLINCTE